MCALSCCSGCSVLCVCARADQQPVNGALPVAMHPFTLQCTGAMPLPFRRRRKRCANQQQAANRSYYVTRTVLQDKVGASITASWLESLQASGTGWIRWQLCQPHSTAPSVRIRAWLATWLIISMAVLHASCLLSALAAPACRVWGHTDSSCIDMNACSSAAFTHHQY